jgi:hypothetical protein
MLETVNKSDWSVEIVPGWDRTGQAVGVVVVRAGYRFDAEGQLGHRETAIEPADRYVGDPRETSLVAAGDGVAFKDATDCLFHGTARPLQPQATAREVRVAVAGDRDRIDKRLRVAGPRHWQATPVGLVPSRAEPLEPTPVDYTHAFGGVDIKARGMERRNPVGMGFSERRRGAKGAALPRVEYLNAPMTRWSQRPAPAALGPLAPGWQPRRQRLDGLDYEALADGRCPYPDPIPGRLFNVAADDQQLEQPLSGGESVYIEGMGLASRSPVRLILPGTAPVAGVATRRDAQRVPLVCDTLIVDADAGTLDLVWRGHVTNQVTDQQKRWVVVAPPKEAAA